MKPILNILVAPTSFKGSLTPIQAAKAISSHIPPEFKVTSLPVADGGDGTLEALTGKITGRFIEVEAADPLGKPIKAEYFLTEDKIAIIELARTSGLNLVSTQHCPAVYGSTRGTGKLIKSALDQEASEIMLTVGGSATADGGVGILKELGFRFLDGRGNEIREGGIGLNDIESIDESEVDSRIFKIPLKVLCDVDNPLLGENGGIAVYSPQKGAGPHQVNLLVQGFTHLSNLIRKNRNKQIGDIRYGGASGGIPAVLSAFLEVEIHPGAELILEWLDFNEIIKEVDLIITGEGRFDQTTHNRKIVSVILERAKKLNKLAIVFCGEIVPNHPQIVAFSISPGLCPKQQLIADAGKYLGSLTSRVFSLISEIYMITSKSLQL